MWINNLTAYHLDFARPDEWAEQFSEYLVKTPELGARRAIGFARDAQGNLVDHVAPHYAFQAAQAERHLPRDAVEREVRLRNLAPDPADAKAYKKAWADVEQELLASAPVREKAIPAIFDEEAKRLYVFGSSSSAEQIVLPAMRLALGSTQARPIRPADGVGKLLNRWLEQGALPQPFALGRHVELREEGKDGGKATFHGRDIGSPEVQRHLENGDYVTLLELSWRGQLTFRLTMKGEVRSIAPPECQMKAQYAFAIWPEIMDRLPHFFDEVMALLGGVRSDAIVAVERKRRGEQAGDAVTDGADVGHTQPEVDSAAPAGVRVAVVLEGDREQALTVRDGLDALATEKALAEIVIPDIGNDLMRMAYHWARTRGIRVRLIRKGDRTPEARADQVFGCKPHGLVAFGQSPEADLYMERAKANRVRVRRLDLLR